MGYLFIAIAHGTGMDVTFIDAMFWNIIPASIGAPFCEYCCCRSYALSDPGNLLGAILFVSGALWFAYGVDARTFGGEVQARRRTCSCH